MQRRNMAEVSEDVTHTHSSLIADVNSLLSSDVVQKPLAVP